MAIETIIMVPDNKVIELDDTSERNIIRYGKINKPNIKYIFANIAEDDSRIDLWLGDDVTTHFYDTEQQLEDKLKDILNM